MQTSFKYKSIAIAASLLLAIVSPRYGMAQRFNHGSVGGGRPAAPAPRQFAPSRPAAPPRMTTPQPSRPVEARPAEPTQVQARPTINGGGRNIGNHDFSRPVDVHTTVNVRDNVTVRNNINVYHTGAYRGAHPYYYHPYRPYYWGPHWHPLGFFLTALATDAIWFSYNNQRYYYDDGCFYLPSNGGYAVVAPPIGAIVAMLPPGYETPVVGNDTYYYFGGVFYVYTGQGYQVVAAPPGAVITQLPVGAADQQIDGQDILVYNGTYYEPISQDGQDAYEVVPPPGQ